MHGILSFGGTLMTALREPGILTVDTLSGVLEGATGRYEKRLSDLAGLYADEAAFSGLAASRGGEVVYDVTDYKPTTSSGDMIVGVTRMSPGKVGAEYFMTRGHIHARPNRPEIYYGERGRGVMLLESPDGGIRAVEIGPRTICFVPPFWIHRSVNVGDDDLVMTFAYPADSGQDYDIIARAGGMRSRVVDDGAGGWRLADNDGYRPRPASLVADILSRTD